MSRVARYLNERLTALDLNLLQRFARRELARVTTGLSMPRGLGPRGSSVSDSQDRSPMAGRNLRGLETTWTTGIGWNVLVSAGAMLIAWTGVDETRPGTWSGKLESDDGSWAVGVLPTSSQVAPSPAPGGALSGYEYWLVYATVSETTIETDSTRRVFNWGTGIFDSAGAAKVRQQRLQLAVVRGTSNGPPPFASLPGGSIVLAMLYVPAGATDLSGAVIFDCRRFPEMAPGPNRVGGQWAFTHEGQITTPYGQTVFRGRVHARLGNELLSARVLPSGITAGALAEPGASWGSASPSAPKIAWLYLCRVGGYTPRPVRRGQSPIAHNGSFLNDSTLIDGALVLSPTPPRIGASTTAAEGPKSGLRWDLRPSATLALPGFDLGTMAYQYGGLTATADNALCVGFMRYTGVDGSIPQLQGSLYVSSEGWMTGSSINSDSTDPSGLALLPTMTPDNGVAPRTLTSGLYGPAEVTIGGVDFPLPLEALRYRLLVEASSNAQPVLGTRSDAGRQWGVGPNNRTYIELDRRVLSPGDKYLPQFQLQVNSSTWIGDLVALIGVRFPYGEDLVS